MFVLFFRKEAALQQREVHLFSLSITVFLLLFTNNTVTMQGLGEVSIPSRYASITGIYIHQINRYNLSIMVCGISIAKFAVYYLCFLLIHILR